MDPDLKDVAFTDDDKAREVFEAIRWPEGPFCPHCGNSDQLRIAKAQGTPRRAGLYYCAECKRHFTVTVGTAMDHSRIPLSKWLLAIHLMSASGTTVSARTLERTLGVSYHTAWFLSRRLRDAMTHAKQGSRARA